MIVGQPVLRLAETVAALDAEVHVRIPVTLDAQQGVEMDAQTVRHVLAAQEVAVELVMADAVLVAILAAKEIVREVVTETVAAVAIPDATVAEAVTADALVAVMDVAVAAVAQTVPEHAVEDAPRLVRQAVPTLVLAAKPVPVVRQTVQRAAEMDVWHPAWLPLEDRGTRYSLTGRQIRMEPEQNITRGIPSKAHKTWTFGRSGNTSISQLTVA